MAKLDNVRRIILEDFPQEDRATVEKLANVLNHFMENVFNVLDGNVDFANLNQEIVTLDVTVGASGTPTKTTKFATSRIRNPRGVVVIKATNRTNGANFPTSCPFVSSSPAGGNLQKINNISGLQANEEYRLTLLILG